MNQHIRRTDKPIDEAYYPSWCGRKLAHHNWVFQDAEHAMLHLAQGPDISPCRACLSAIKKLIEKELNP